MKKLILFLVLIFPLLGFGQAGSFEWAMDCGNPPNTTDGKTTLAATFDGGMVMAGEFTDTASFEDTAIVSAGGTDIFLARYDAYGDLLWVVRIGGGDYDFVQKVVAGNEGSIFLCGYFYGTTQIGPDTYTSMGSQDLFVARFDQQGNQEWSAHAGGLMADYISSIALGLEGEVLAAGYFYGEMAIGDTLLLATAGSDVFIGRYDQDGSFVDAMVLGGSSSDQVRSVSSDPFGNAFISGSFYDDVTIGDTTLVTEDPVGVYFAKLEPDFSLAWARQLDGTSLSAEAYSTFDHDGNIYLAGNFSGEITFSDKPFVAGEFNQDIYVARYSGFGELIWARHGHSDGSDQVTGLGIDPSDNLYITGHYLDTIQFDDLTLLYTLCCGSREVFAVNYATDGAVVWGQQVSGARANIQAMSVSDNGRLFMSGLYTEDLFLGPYTLSYFEGFRNYYTAIYTDIYARMEEPLPAQPDLYVFPNPARGHIKVSGNMGEDFSQLMILDFGGRMLLTAGEGKEYVLDVSRLQPGKFVVIAIEKYSGKVMRQIFLKF